MSTPPTLLRLLLILPLLFLFAAPAQAQLVEEESDDLSAYPYVGSLGGASESAAAAGEGGLLLFNEEAVEDGVEGMDSMDESARRALLWRIQYFISYAALSANRIPCPARSGRSYYTHNCYRARGRANPYHRGCSAITRCRR